MNKRGQFLLVAIMIAIWAFIFAIMAAPVIKTLVDTSRDSSNMDCEATNLTAGAAAGCVAVDLFLPSLVVVILSVGLGVITARSGGPLRG